MWLQPGVESSGKNAVSVESYPEDFFPSFCGGLAYFMTMTAVRKLLETHRINSDFLWLDDVYITGILSRKGNIPLINIEEHYYSATATTVPQIKATNRLVDYLIYGPGQIDSLKRTWTSININYEAGNNNWIQLKKQHKLQRQNLLFKSVKIKKAI